MADKATIPKQVSPSNSKLKEIAKVRRGHSPAAGSVLISPVAPYYITVQMTECARAWKAFADNLKQKPPEEETAQKKYKQQRKEVGDTSCIELLLIFRLAAGLLIVCAAALTAGIAGD